jgi:hypothetical protein
MTKVINTWLFIVSEGINVEDLWLQSVNENICNKRMEKITEHEIYN